MAERTNALSVERVRGGAYRLESRLVVPRPIDAVFPFFSDAHNLEEVTPPWLAFRVVTPGPIRVEPGVRIDYRLRVRGIPVRWTSEIDVWEPPYRFGDWQVRGPYRSWRHEHTFSEHDGGTLVGDRVDFEVPLAFLAGRLVAADVERIFRYRQTRMLELFAP